jgi:hypothetical protein
MDVKAEASDCLQQSALTSIPRSLAALLIG